MNDGGKKTGAKILCVGAGGAGMSAIVRWHLQLGDMVYVYDDVIGSVELLAKYPGAKVWDDDSSMINSSSAVDLAVFSDAVPQDHSLRREMVTREVPVRGFAEELGALCAGH